MMNELAQLRKRIAELEASDAERKRVEEALRQDKEEYRTLFENTGTATIIVEEDTTISLVNQEFERLSGYSREEIEGKKSWTEFVAPEDLGRMKEYHQSRRAYPASAPRHYEFKSVDKQGTIKDIFLTVAMIPGTNKSVASLLDLTERKNAEREARYQRDYFRSLFEGSPEAVATLDLQRRVLDTNPAFEKLFGYSPEDIKGKDMHTFILPQGKEGEGEDISQRASQGEIVAAQTVRRAADGRGIPISVLGAPVTVEGRQIGVLAIYRDISDRKKAEERLERSFIDLAETFARAEAYRDPYSSAHQRRVAQLVRAVGEKMGLDRDKLLGLEIGGLLHDIGKISVPEPILNKPGPLGKEEWGLVRLHARRGHEILQASNLPWPVAEMALHHHERLDGSGYPEGIRGDEFSLETRILAVCNVAEAMSAHRPYRMARSREEIVAELRGGRRTQYDARVVDILLEMTNAGALELEGSQT